LGGLASVWGSLAGAVILAVIEAETSSSSGWEPVILGGAVVVLLLFLPRGLADFPYRASQALRRWRGRGSRAATRASGAEAR
jgi:branched-chain amino acid transport system permease protein